MPSVRADIGRYTCVYGTAAAARHFSKKLGHPVDASYVHSIKKAYKEKGAKRAERDGEDVRVLPPKKRGRPLFLCKDLDGKLQQYMLKVRDGGGIVSARIMIAAARGIS